MEKIKLKLKLYNNGVKAPSFRVFINETIMIEKIQCHDQEYENTLQVDLEKGDNSLKIEHFGKDPRDTLDNTKDVAVELKGLWFNNIKISEIDLYSYDFHVTKWRYPVSPIVKNSLYFGFNGVYDYKFSSPITIHALNVHKKHQKENFQVEQIENVTEDEFITKLKQCLDVEKGFFKI